MLLAIGFVLKLAPYIWTYFLGWVFLTLLGIQAESITRKLLNSYKPRLPWVGLFFVFAWHLTWSAVSGMETLLDGYIIFVILSMLISGSRRYLALGLLVGLSIWVRPDGLTLLGPIFFTAVFREKFSKSFTDALIKSLIGFGTLFGPYLLFNLALSGNPMPNTFYAKQAEYEAYWLSKTLLERITDYIFPLIASPSLVLLPGAVLWVNKMIRTRNWATIASVIWFFGYIAIYFMRLPAYQHGRYIIPAFPIFYLWGVLGMIEYISSWNANRRIAFTWPVLLGTLCLLFSFIAARQNAYDVQWVEDEMVQTAKWIQQNIPQDALIAVHDIGAIGYFDQHKIVDLAGLASPDVVTFIRNQDQVAKYLDERGVSYLVTFPSFYPELASRHEPVFSINGFCTSSSGAENICIYPWK